MRFPQEIAFVSQHLQEEWRRHIKAWCEITCMDAPLKKVSKVVEFLKKKEIFYHVYLNTYRALQFGGIFYQTIMWYTFWNLCREENALFKMIQFAF